MPSDAAASPPVAGLCLDKANCTGAPAKAELPSALLLQALLDGLSAQVCVLDVAGVVMVVNRAWRAFGARHGATADAVGRSYLQVCEHSAAGVDAGSEPGLDPGLFAQKLRQVLAGERSGFEHEHRCVTPDGEQWFLARASRMPVGTAAAAIVAHEDITALKALEAQRRNDQQRYRTLFETVPQGVVHQDAHGRITDANPAAQRILGFTLAQLQGRQSIDLRWQALREDGSPFPGEEHPAMVALRSGQPVRNAVMAVASPDAQGHVWLLVNANPVIVDGQVQEVYTTIEDITERVHLGRELKRQASTDDLTGTANRRSLVQRLGEEYARVRASAEHRCAVLAVDMDLFKQVNDSFGHAAGDAVLQHAADLMRRVTRNQDMVARSGGEEFVLLLPDTGLEEARALAERLRGWLQAQPVLHHGLALSVTVSIGVSQILHTDADLDAVLARADQALYRAKAAGRNRVWLATTAGGHPVAG